MSLTRRVTRPIATLGPGPAKAPPERHPLDEITYKGYRIEPGSYCISTGAWFPRVVVSLKTEDGSARRTPLYSTDATKCPTRDEADRRALDVARAWIDAAGDRPRD